MRFKTSVGIIVVFALLLQGCGRKGPLTMPVPVVYKAVTAAPASAVPAVPQGK
jgi:predicted small lipoprotein YifL